ncbi:MAG: hypothetical protein FWG55_01300 [Candidatus Bathyarchaeota archaeon]|nr:hypothetical protein [Candidatus Termiticorpusculum sp.]
MSNDVPTQIFNGYNCDLGQLQKSVAIHFVGKGFFITNFHKATLYVVQAYKNFLGNRAIICQIVGTPEKFDVTIGIGDKISNINTLPTITKISFGTRMQLDDPLIERNLFSFMSTQAELNRNTFGVFTPTISTVSPVQVVKEREIVREIEVIYCRYCGAKNNARLSNCSTCNAALH